MPVLIFTCSMIAVSTMDVGSAASASRSSLPTLSNTEEESMSEPLKPCPFCGGEAEIAIGQHHFNDAKVVCDCGIESGLFDETENKETNAKAAIKAWNTRAPDPKVKRLVEAARDEENNIEGGCRDKLREALKEWDDMN